VVRGIGEIFTEQISVARLAIEIDRSLNVTRTIAITVAVIAVVALPISIAEIARIALAAMIAAVASIAWLIAVIARLFAMLARLTHFARLTHLTRCGAGLAHITHFFAAVSAVGRTDGRTVAFQLATLTATAAATATATAALFSGAARFVEAGEDRIVVVRLGGENVGARKRRALGLHRHDLGFARFARLGGRGGFSISIHGMLPESEYARPHLHDARLAPVLFDQSRQTRAHRDFRCFADVREKISLDRDLCDLFEMERLTRAAENLQSGFGKRHEHGSYEGA